MYSKEDAGSKWAIGGGGELDLVKRRRGSYFLAGRVKLNTEPWLSREDMSTVVDSFLASLRVT